MLSVELSSSVNNILLIYLAEQKSFEILKYVLISVADVLFLNIKSSSITESKMKVTVSHFINGSTIQYSSKKRNYNINTKNKTTVIMTNDTILKGGPKK